MHKHEVVYRLILSGGWCSRFLVIQLFVCTWFFVCIYPHTLKPGPGSHSREASVHTEILEFLPMVTVWMGVWVGAEIQGLAFLINADWGLNWGSQCHRCLLSYHPSQNLGRGCVVSVCLFTTLFLHAFLTGTSHVTSTIEGCNRGEETHWEKIISMFSTFYLSLRHFDPLKVPCDS